MKEPNIRKQSRSISNVELMRLNCRADDVTQEEVELLIDEVFRLKKMRTQVMRELTVARRGTNRNQNLEIAISRAMDALTQLPKRKRFK